MEHVVLWGKKRDLKVDWRSGAGRYYIADEVVVLQMRPGTTTEQRQELLKRMMRDEIRRKAAPIIKEWSDNLNLLEPRLFVQMMRTQWGSCNTYSGSIRLNSELAKYHPDCLEYVIVHELCHLVEPYHNEHFYELVQTCMPDWKERRKALADYPEVKDE